jgi:serine/threonine protein kinase
LSLMQSPALHHPNIIDCKYAWQERNNPQDSNQVVLYLLLEYVPSTLYTHYRIWAKKRLLFPELLCKVYLFQVSSSFLHTVSSSETRELHTLSRTDDSGSRLPLAKTASSSFGLVSRYRSLSSRYKATQYTHW